MSELSMEQVYSTMDLFGASAFVSKEALEDTAFEALELLAEAQRQKLVADIMSQIQESLDKDGVVVQQEDVAEEMALKFTTQVVLIKDFDAFMTALKAVLKEAIKKDLTRSLRQAFEEAGFSEPNPN